MRAIAAMNIDRQRRWLVLPVMLLVAVAVALGLLALQAITDPAEAAFPGINGRIAFTSTEVTAGNPDGGAEIYTMNPDGTDIQQLTHNSNVGVYGGNDIHPAWSADGTQIAFTSNRDNGKDSEIYKMNADETNQTRLTNNPSAPNFRPAWSPDCTQIAFVSQRDGQTEIYKMKADGTQQTNLTNTPTQVEESPDWSPGGNKIAFSRLLDDFLGIQAIFTMNTDGTQQTRLTNDDTLNSGPN
jgi:Tol biopolymer transport system component